MICKTSIKLNKLLKIINKESHAFIIDKFNEKYSIIGFLNFNLTENKTITTNKIDDLYSLENYKKSCAPTPLKKQLSIINSGWFGYLSYDLKNNIFPFLKSKQTEFPLIQFASFPVLFLVEHKTKGIIAISENKKIYKDYIRYINSTHYNTDERFFLNLLYMEPYNIYERKINRIKELIENGEVYQINLAHRLMFHFEGNPLGCYLNIREEAKPPFGCYLKFNDLNILSFSPERFFRVHNNKISSYPIKGTMPRSDIKKIDKSYKEKLKQSEKDHAEHIMIIDLIRNDLGKICKIGSVKVTNLFSVKSYETVHHMVSCISGDLMKPYDLVKIIKAIFPGGSITGAPKIAAMKYIDELEDFSREIYTGSIGYFLPDYSFMDFNIAIRTMVIHNNIAYYSVGGGIVFDSDAQKEYEETITKSQIIKRGSRGLADLRM